MLTPMALRRGLVPPDIHPYPASQDEDDQRAYSPRPRARVRSSHPPEARDPRRRSARASRETGRDSKADEALNGRAQTESRSSRNSCTSWST